MGRENLVLYFPVPFAADLARMSIAADRRVAAFNVRGGLFVYGSTYASKRPRPFVPFTPEMTTV
jgi:hypothetical protein